MREGVWVPVTVRVMVAVCEGVWLGVTVRDAVTDPVCEGVPVREGDWLPVLDMDPV